MAHVCEQLQCQLRALATHVWPGLRLQHLPCCVQVNASLAAAAAAVVDLSGQLLKAKDQAQESTWRSQLETVLQQQQTKLQAWAHAQVRMCGACTGACNHIGQLGLIDRRLIGHFLATISVTLVAHSCSILPRTRCSIEPCTSPHLYPTCS